MSGQQNRCRLALFAHQQREFLVSSAYLAYVQGVKNLKNQPMVGFSGRTDGLQMNVGLPSAGGLADKVPPASCCSVFVL